VPPPTPSAPRTMDEDITADMLSAPAQQ
jgi:hypothetical protein